MSEHLTNHLVELGEAYADHTNLTHWRVSYLLRGDGQFLKRLKEGGGCTVKTAAIAMTWFATNWPEDLEWPSTIPRPEKKEAA